MLSISVVTIKAHERAELTDDDERNLPQRALWLMGLTAGCHVGYAGLARSLIYGSLKTSLFRTSLVTLNH